MSASKNLLERLIQIIDEKVAAAPPFPKPYEREAAEIHHAAGVRILQELVNEEAATYNGGKPWDGSRLKLAGIKSSCTSGAFGLLSNWQAAAQRRIDEGKAL